MLPLLEIDKHDGIVAPAFYSLLEGLPVRAPRKLLFVNIPQVPADVFNLETARRNGYQIYPPIGYLYLAAAAHRANPDLEIEILDLNYQMLRLCHEGLLAGSVWDFWKAIVAHAIGEEDGLHVCVGNMFEATTPAFLAITGFIRDNFPQVTLLGGGVQTTLDYVETLEKRHSHVVFLYEAEKSFQVFLKACAGDPDAEVPAAIAFQNGGTIIRTPGHPGDVEQFLDIRPFYALIEDFKNYHRYGGVNPYSRYVGKEVRFATLLVNRGCRARCTFCGVRSFNGLGVRRRSARSVVDELKYLVEEKGVRLIEWLDDDLLFGKSESTELFRMMAEELPDDVEWIANNGVIAGAVTEEIMEWMVKSRCRAFKVGIESGNEAMLKKIKKPGSKASLRKAGRLFDRYPQIFVSANFIVGFPGESFGEMLDSFDFANELSWDWANYYICQPLPGTDVFDAFQSMGDDRCGKDGVGVYNPGKSVAQKGNFGYCKGYHADDELARSIYSGREVFGIERGAKPSAEQIKEIWFAFNLITNFINNRNWRPGGNVEKLVRWFESIVASYPNDAAMCAMLAYGHRLLHNGLRSDSFRQRFESLVDQHDYWKRRLEEFPELEGFAYSALVVDEIVKDYDSR